MAKRYFADGEPVLTTGAVAAQFRVTPMTIREWVRSGRIPADAVVDTPEGRRFSAPAVRALSDDAEAHAS